MKGSLGQNTRLSDNWKAHRPPGDTGPVLVEVVFLEAMVLAFFPLAQPGISWLHLACVVSTGTLYGWIRCRSTSAAPAAVSHALYNLSLYAISGAVLLGEKIMAER